MSQRFQPIQLLKDKFAAGKTGHFQTTTNSVTWELYLVKGKLQYARHSLQSLETLEHYLLCLGHGDVAKIAPMLVQNVSDKDQLISVANQLVEQNYLSSSQSKTLMRELSQDALEFFFWLTDGKSHWNFTHALQSFNSADTVEENLLELPPLLESLQTRLQEWQKLSPLITSPFQRLLCVNPSRLQQKVPSGSLSPAILEKLVNLMQGATIRQLGLFLKQDNLKVAQLLFPYIQHQILQLHSPKPPLDKLPKIPPLLLNSRPSTPTVNLIIPTKIIPPVQSEQKIYKIVCIDDSPTILDMIKDYLKTEKYEIFTINDPMKSLTCLFDSKPDLVLMDFSMPGINGNRLCQILKSSSAFKHIPIIMVSGNTHMLDKAKIQATGVTDFLAKPFTQKSLMATLDKYLK